MLQSMGSQRVRYNLVTEQREVSLLLFTYVRTQVRFHRTSKQCCRPKCSTRGFPPSFAGKADGGEPSGSNMHCEGTAAAKSLLSCPTLCDPIDGSPPGSPVLGFSRQEHWSGLPFPSPVHESEK